MRKLVSTRCPRFARPSTILPLVAVMLGALASHAHAGIVVLKNGRVVLGRIDAEDVTQDAITLHQPKLHPSEAPLAGQQTFRRGEVRWFDAQADDLTCEYAKAHRDDPIDTRWAASLAKRLEEIDEAPPIPEFHFVDPKRVLSPVALAVPGAPGVVIRRPNGWVVESTDGIFVARGDRAGAHGFAPRLHAFAVEAPRKAPTEQIAWVKSELAKLAREGGFELLPGSDESTRVVRDGFFVEWLTVTRRGGRAVRALRHVHFRESATIFVTAYADEDDFPKLVGTLRAAAASLEF